MNRYISIAGNIGSGKSTLINKLKNVTDCRVFLEPDNNEFLEDFYGDEARWAFHSQIYYIAEFIEIHQKISDIKDEVVFQERSLHESFNIFVKEMYKKQILPAREYFVCEKLYKTFQLNFKRPDLIIYLECDTQDLLSRIRSRGRRGEEKITAGYLECLQKSYKSWINSINYCEVLILESIEEENEKNMKKIISKIR